MAWGNTSTRTSSTTWRRLRRKAKTELPYVCAECFVDGAVEPLELDHIVPVAEGGEDDIENVQWLCGRCHGVKTAEDTRRGQARWRARKKRPQPPHPGLRSSAPGAG